MVSILLLAIGVGAATFILGSLAFQMQAPINDAVLSPLEEKCQQIANEGYKIHSKYPESNPDDIPVDDMRRLLSLDDKWMTECVAALPAEKIFEIANNVERNVSFGE